ESKTSQVDCEENDCSGSGTDGCSIKYTVVKAALCACEKEFSTAKTKDDCKRNEFEFFGTCEWNEAVYSTKCSGRKTITTTNDICTGTRILVASPSPSPDKTCPNADPYPPGKHGEVSWIGEINYVCNGVNGEWIDCNNKAKLKRSPFGENFECQSGGSKTQECTPNKCLDNNKLQKCTKTGTLPKYEIIDCTKEGKGKVCSEKDGKAQCVAKVICSGFPLCPGNPKLLKKCEIIDNEHSFTYDQCQGDEVCQGEDGSAKCLAPPPPPDCSNKPDFCTDTGQLNHCDPQTGNYVTKDCSTNFICPPGENACIKYSLHPNCAKLPNYCANDGTLNYCDPITGQYANKPCQTGKVCPDGGNACVGAFDCSTKPDVCTDTGQLNHCDTRTGYYVTKDCPADLTCPVGGKACAPLTIGAVGSRCSLWIPWSSRACEKCPGGEFIKDLDGNPWNGQQAYCLKPSDCQANQRQCTSNNVLEKCTNGQWETLLDCNIYNKVCQKTEKSFACQ
ncbi:MAG: hypothetical protein ABII80_02635, partial [bacterium]